jgi:DNA-binding NarL/FixJ family response regulator
MYCLSALNRFEDKSQEEVRYIVAEIALLGRSGLDYASAEKKYTLQTLRGETFSGLQLMYLIYLARELQPDVIIMDLQMPELNGIEATVAIRQERPDARILVLTSFDEQDRITAIMAAGASGFLLKDSGADELLQAIRGVHRGNIILSPKVMQALSSRDSSSPQTAPGTIVLTPRKVEVLRGIVNGLTNQAIAVNLGISSTTVRSHVSTILSKLDVTNRTQAALVARELDLI